MLMVDFKMLLLPNVQREQRFIYLFLSDKQICLQIKRSALSQTDFKKEGSFCYFVKTTKTKKSRNESTTKWQLLCRESLEVCISKWQNKLVILLLTIFIF